MTRLNAYIPVNMTLLNLNRIWGEAYRTELVQDVSDIPEIRDWFSVFSELDGDYYWSVIAGPSLTLINDTVPTGTATAYCEFMYWGDRYVPLWEIWGAEFPAQALYEAAGTSSTEDDLALMREVLAGDDLMLFSNGDDVGLGYTGSDELRGFDGNDVLRGGSGSDLLIGNAGADRLYGGEHKDTLSGNRGADSLYGRAGRDVLQGGRGNDVMIGGSHADRFIFNDGDGRDVVRDFTDDVDTLVLDSDLWEGDLYRIQVINRYAEVVDGATLLDFGEEQITLAGFDDLDALRNDIEIA
ncbi:calcium-binding protein [Tropicimonas sediminicola]|uniref:Hemolysin-type calcium-binding repeat-containing protein n=1 Tax=Tropicimonas sediminicola TaxID=1031541 RepID=A0A239CG96_9RHOB|nr:calcium-binding protein [Tropicimonas sediminicola]SNS18494.1 Hemolysin-type calcium-binding repeat-containing protein [Tropicimonas sediminicola]